MYRPVLDKSGHKVLRFHYTGPYYICEKVPKTFAGQLGNNRLVYRLPLWVTRRLLFYMKITRLQPLFLTKLQLIQQIT